MKPIFEQRTLDDLGLGDGDTFPSQPANPPSPAGTNDQSCAGPAGSTIANATSNMDLGRSARRNILSNAGERDPSASSDAPHGQLTADDALTAPGVSDSAEPNRPDTLRDRRVWIVDAHSLIYQVFHALPEMTGPAGQAVGAIHGFIRDVVDIIEKHRPDYLLCAFDYSDVTFRTDLYESYKQHRAPMPEDLRSQLDGISKMLDAMGIPQLAVPGFEADDILATVAQRVRQAGGYCILVTNDKDCRQLISDRVWMYNPRTGKMLDSRGLIEEWGIRPEQVVDYQALVGDAVDAVPGVPLVGPYVARQWLQKYGTLENLVAHANELPPGKRRENLLKFHEQALLSRQLVRLRTDVPLQWDWPHWRLGQYKVDRLKQLCRDFGFRQLARRLLALAGTSEEAADGEILSEIAFQVVDRVDLLDRLIEKLSTAAHFTVDLETTSVHPRGAEIVGIAIACDTQQGWYIPIRAPAGEAVLDEQLVKERLRPLLEDPSRAKVGQNVKYDAVVLRSAGVRAAGWAFDTMVADYLLAPGERNHSLDDLARRYLDYQTIRISSLIGSGSRQRRMDEVPVEKVARYAAADAVLPLRLMPLLKQRLENFQLDRLFSDLEMPLVDVLAEMEYTGIRVDVERLRQLSKQLRWRLEVLQQEIFHLAGGPFNIDSPRQVADVLFGRLKLPVQKRTPKSGPSTDVEVLESLAQHHPVPARMLEYRQLAKLKSTYVDALPELVHPGTGRIHTSFKQDVAATGRLSSQDPNLQNIPVRTPEGLAIREAFVPEEGWRLVSADYSQIELRILAHFTEDAALLEAFSREEDIHRHVAAEVFGVAPDQVTAEQRRRAKAVNFGIIYGQTAFGLAKALGIEQSEAAAFIEAYFARYPGVQQFIDRTLDTCLKNGYVSTILGRRRWIEGVRPRSRRKDRSRILPERIAVNTVIQGSAADLIKLAMVRIHRRLTRENWQARMLLQIHDELLFEVAPDDEAKLRQLLSCEMTQVLPLRVPLRIDLHSGKNWAECG